MATSAEPAPTRDGDGLPPAGTTIGQYLIDRLHALGVEHVFGIPGDYVLGLYKMLEASPIRLVGMTREDNAGFAADAYARLHGLGCVCVTYCVGGLSLCNSVAGAYAEKSPVIVLSGSPGLSERAHNPLLHHKVRDFSTQFEVFEKITVASAVLDDPLTAFREIDRVIEAALRYKRPVYLEIPRDQVLARQVTPHRTPVGLPPSDPGALREAIDEAAALLLAAERPMILADVEYPPLRPPGRAGRAGRGDRHADRDDDPGQERRLRGAPALRRRLRGGDGTRRGHDDGRGGRLPADARLLPDRHQPRHLHRQARPLAVHRRDERGPADPPPPLPRGPPRRLPPRPDRPRDVAGEDPDPAPGRRVLEDVGRRAGQGGSRRAGSSRG